MPGILRVPASEGPAASAGWGKMICALSSLKSLKFLHGARSNPPVSLPASSSSSRPIPGLARNPTWGRLEIIALRVPLPPRVAEKEALCLSRYSLSVASRASRKAARRTWRSSSLSGAGGIRPNSEKDKSPLAEGVRCRGGRVLAVDWSTLVAVEGRGTDDQSLRDVVQRLSVLRRADPGKISLQGSTQALSTSPPGLGSARIFARQSAIPVVRSCCRCEEDDDCS